MQSFAKTTGTLAATVTARLLLLVATTAAPAKMLLLRPTLAGPTFYLKF